MNIEHDISNKLAESIVRCFESKEKCSYLDGDKIVWKLIDNKWIGKRSVWTFDFKSCWLEDTTVDNVKSWWAGGIEADYNKIID